MIMATKIMSIEEFRKLFNLSGQELCEENGTVRKVHFSNARIHSLRLETIITGGQRKISFLEISGLVCMPDVAVSEGDHIYFKCTKKNEGPPSIGYDLKSSEIANITTGRAYVGE